MSENQVLVPSEQNTEVANITNDVFGELASASRYWPYMKVMGSNSEECKEGKCPPGVFARLTGKSIEPVGKECLVIPLAYRATAMDVEEGIFNHDPSSAEFRKIRELSAENPTGYLAGIEFLFYDAARQDCVTFYCASKSAKQIAPTIRDYLGRMTLLTVEFVKNKKWSWHAPAVQPSSTPLDHELNMAYINEQKERFLNPKVEEVAPEATPGREV